MGKSHYKWPFSIAMYYVRLPEGTILINCLFPGGQTFVFQGLGKPWRAESWFGQAVNLRGHHGVFIIDLVLSIHQIAACWIINPVLIMKLMEHLNSVKTWARFHEGLYYLYPLAYMSHAFRMFSHVCPWFSHPMDHPKQQRRPAGAGILRDATRLMRRHVGATESIQQCGLAVVDVTQPEQ